MYTNVVFIFNMKNKNDLHLKCLVCVNHASFMYLYIKKKQKQNIIKTFEK